MDKIKALREFMETKGLSALLIPRTDEFQGEYIAPYAQRLCWLTGFTGSAGFVVLTKDRIAFFTDGRYLLQAKEELPSFYERYNVADISPVQWVNEILSETEKVGYDPWLFTETQLQAYQRMLIPLEENPIDKLWQDRPLPPHDFIQLHPLKFSGESDERKRSRIGQGLKADQVLLTSCDSIAWLLNIRGTDVPHTPIVHSFCVLKKDGRYDLFVDLNKINGEVCGYILKGQGRVIDIHQIKTHLQQVKGTCQIDPQTTPMSCLQALEKAGVDIIRERDPCLLPKALKNESEIQGAIHAHIQDGIALRDFFSWLKAQPLKGETTELTAAQKLYEFRKKGEYFKDLSFDTISGCGPHGAIIHYSVTPESDLPLKKQGLYLVDSGGQYLTGTTDVTRTLVLARQFLWEKGCDYDHGTGHGVGSYLSVHEGPQGISKRGTQVPLQPGMILSNEPGYYKEGEYGIRIESLIRVVLCPQKQDFYQFETLTLVPFEEKLIEETLLTEKEKKWIRDYHKKIEETLFLSN